MSVFKDHKITAAELLNVIPEDLLSNLSQETKVDYYTKVLHGKKLFYLLMYGILENERLSQRTLEDTFNEIKSNLKWSKSDIGNTKRIKAYFENLFLLLINKVLFKVLS